jgi:hypothetical protein
MITIGVRHNKIFQFLKFTDVKYYKGYKFISTRLYTLKVKVKVKVKLSLYRQWRPLELREVEASTFSDIRLIDGGKVVNPTPRPLFTPRKIPGTHFC